MIYELNYCLIFISPSFFRSIIDFSIFVSISRICYQLSIIIALCGNFFLLHLYSTTILLYFLFNKFHSYIHFCCIPADIVNVRKSMCVEKNFSHWNFCFHNVNVRILLGWILGFNENARLKIINIEHWNYKSIIVWYFIKGLSSAQFLAVMTCFLVS